MKKQIGTVILCSAAVLGGLAFSQNPPAQVSAEKRLENLESELATARQRIDALAGEAAEAKARLAAIGKHVEQQAKAAAAMARTLDAAEKAGFTYGINPDSRALLLKGWRDQLATAQKSLPAAPTGPAASAAKAGAQR